MARFSPHARCPGAAPLATSAVRLIAAVSATTAAVVVLAAAMAVLTAAPGLVAPAAAQGERLDGLGHDRGQPDAPVLVIEFADFGCHYCALFAHETFPALDGEFIQPGRVRWKLVPFVLGAFRNSRQAAEAAVCAGDQDAFWPMHDRLFAGRATWSRDRRPWERFGRYAAELGLDTARFTACAANRAARERVTQHDAAAKWFRVRATPTFFVNGQRVEGALPLEMFRKVLERALRESAGG